MNNTISVDNTLNVIENQNTTRNTTRKNSNIKEVINIYPSNITKLILHPKNRDSISFIRNQAYGICKSKMPTNYIHKVFNRFERGYVYYRHNSNIPFAFCLWKIRERERINNDDRELYILLICGNSPDIKIVPYVLYDLIDLCIKNGISRISLLPANDELAQYYIKCGFEYSKNEYDNDFLVLDISKLHIRLPRARKTRKQLRHIIGSK